MVLLEQIPGKRDFAPANSGNGLEAMEYFRALMMIWRSSPEPGGTSVLKISTTLSSGMSTGVHPWPERISIFIA